MHLLGGRAAKNKGNVIATMQIILIITLRSYMKANLEPINIIVVINIMYYVVYYVL